MMYVIESRQVKHLREKGEAVYYDGNNGWTDDLERAHKAYTLDEALQIMKRLKVDGAIHLTMGGIMGSVEGFLVGDFNVPNTDVFIVLHKVILKFDGRQWWQFAKSGMEYREDVRVKLVANAWKRYCTEKEYYRHAMRGIFCDNVAGNFPRRSGGKHVCCKCGGKSDVVLHSYQSGCTNFRRFSFCLKCLGGGDVISPSRAKRCRICGMHSPDRVILSESGTSRSNGVFSVNVHHDCVHNILDHVVSKPQWEKFNYNVTLV